ncbi:hypothetical protein [Tautonia plasticadhaerens]|uniref:Uncharacterized protein n=1 Tax=Tautonia plasticadhaerens TaxID=2527974 RepID=A0A518H2U0_9BACT|nr:hypothetical protein [Tautonia plasticadhaerens]QDV35151.1 hypothetical protein ElP_30540 [Tautonia plasticadhaerens]
MTAPDAEPDEEEAASLASVETEIRQMLGLFDAPSFARRGQDLESSLSRLHGRCSAARAGMLEFVHLRLRQWAAVATGQDDWSDAFDGPVADLWTLSGSKEPPRWADQPAPGRRRRAVARDLAASVERFNRRWARFVEELDLGPVNRRIEDYNRYYVLEKECALGSHRIAARLFRPVDPLSADDLLARHPPLPTPRPIS